MHRITTKGNRRRFSFEFKKYWQVYVMILLPLAFLLIFHFAPIVGLILAFKDYSFREGMFGSEWVGLKYFEQFFSNPIFPQLMRNTLTLSIYYLLAAFPFPIILALILNECRFTKFKKFVQLVTYAPNFISTVIIVGMLIQFLHLRFGVVNNILGLIGLTPIDFMGKPSLFSSIYVWSGVWQTAGYASIIYLAALGNVDQEVVESTLIDGANRIQRIWHVDLPTIAPTIVISLILAVGGIMSIGFEKVFLLQNSLNEHVSEIISTYVYKRGLLLNDYSYATAVGLFNSVINCILLVSVNFVAKRLGKTSLW